MEESLRVVLWGVGAMGSGIYRLLQERYNVQIVGAVGQNPAKIGKDLGVIVENKPCDVIVSSDARKVLSEARADLVLHSTCSYIKTAYPEITMAIQHGCDVITIAEEMAEPWSADSLLADNLNNEAINNNVTVLGTGINPGFILDALIIALTGVCYRVDKIEAERVNDLSPFGKTVMKTQGVGSTPEEFKKGVLEGDIVGHIGFPQSISLIGQALGWKLDNIEEKKEPIISSTRRKTDYIDVAPGMVAGCYHRATGYVDGKVVIELKHPQQVCPELENEKTGDFIKVHGVPKINLSIQPEIPGGTGTIAMAVNMIPIVMRAEAGLKTLVELPFPSAWNKIKQMNI